MADKKPKMICVPEEEYVILVEAAFLLEDYSKRLEKAESRLFEYDRRYLGSYADGC